MASAAVAGFVQALCQTPLLDDARRQEVAASLAIRFPDPVDLGRELLRRDWLTAFQLNQIFTGHGSDLILGPYVLLERVGSGGMGQVFKALHQRLNRVVALKVIRKTRLAQANAVPRFHREIQAVAQLAHPNIVRAYDADQVDGTPFLAMEYVEGTDLDRLVRESGPLKVAQACDYVRQAALGLQHAHEHGMVHRDIKPANLLVARTVGRGSGSLLPPPAPASPWGVVKILDLGLARLRETTQEDALERLTQVGKVLGTPDFIAPEQVWHPQTCDIRADLYSLGCTLYFLLTGQVPFAAGSPAEKFVKHQAETPEPVALVRRTRLSGNDAPYGGDAKPPNDLEVPAEVAAIVHKLMAKRPEARFQVPAELADALAAISHEAGPVPLAQPLEQSVGQTNARISPGKRGKSRPTPRRATTRAIIAPLADTVEMPRPPTRVNLHRRKRHRVLAQRSRVLLVFGGYLLVWMLAMRVAGYPGRSAQDGCGVRRAVTGQVCNGGAQQRDAAKHR
jgi:serine/threonine-protein kinase